MCNRWNDATEEDPVDETVASPSIAMLLPLLFCGGVWKCSVKEEVDAEAAGVVGGAATSPSSSSTATAATALLLLRSLSRASASDVASSRHTASQSRTRTNAHVIKDFCKAERDLFLKTLNLGFILKFFSWAHV